MYNHQLLVHGPEKKNLLISMIFKTVGDFSHPESAIFLTVLALRTSVLFIQSLDIQQHIYSNLILAPPNADYQPNADYRKCLDYSN